MNFKKFHESKNLFDKADTSQFYDNTTLAGGEYWSYSSQSTGIVIRIPCKGNTTYTLACDITTSIWRISLSNTDSIPNNVAAVTVNAIVRDKPSDGVYSFATTSNTKYILFQISSSVFNDAIDNIMLNEGSQPLPYEPYDSEVWHDIHHYIMGTDTDTITTLPAIIYPNDTNVTLEITGNTGGTGDRTANLFDKDNADIYPSTNITVGLSRWTAYDGIAQTVRIPCSANTTYAISIDSAIEQTVFRGLLINTDTVPTIGNAVTGTIVISSSDDNTAVFTTLSDTKYIVFQFSANIFDDAIDSLMMVEGSTPQTYEHYGYRIPVVCGEITTNVYSSTQLGISDSITATVSCTAGENSIDVQTTIAPSEITANYHGWHPVSAVHERENGQWD